ncbi:tubulin-specific chaperone D-like isoform X2 [Hyperolius riggenbachi]
MNLPRSGQPSKITPRAPRKLIREATKDPRTTSQELQASLASIKRANTQDLIVNLQMSCMEPVSREVCAQRCKVIMDNYQEQPHLLDPHLG